VAALRAELDGLLRDQADVWRLDPRDLMIALAPLHDCARRLGADPEELFAAAADHAPAGLEGVVRDFGARRDITLAAFGFRLDEEAPGGPAYRFGWPPLTR
jgi:hypothetical protein